MIPICATKDMELWHIRKNATETECGQLVFSFSFEIRSLSRNKKNYCPICLTKRKTSNSSPNGWDKNVDNEG